MPANPVLLNPGPVNLSRRVREALTKPDLCHREVEFADLQRRIRAGLLRAYELSAADYTSVLLSGSGTAAVEAMISSLVPANGRLLVTVNGVYGERIARIASAHGIPHEALTLPWGAEIDPAAVEAALTADPRISHVALIHHETTTGRLNALPEIGQVCRRLDRRLLVDAVSSFGAEAIPFDDANIEACAVSSNKCLHGAAGAAFVICRRASLAAGSAGRSVYLDLRTHWLEQEKDSCAFTPAVPVLYALDEALSEFFEQGGQHARRDRYLALATMVRARMAGLGVAAYLTGGPLASALTAFALPAHTTYQALHDRLRAAGFVIYAGQGGLSREIFRIATMGEVTVDDLDRLFLEVERALCELSS